MAAHEAKAMGNDPALAPAKNPAAQPPAAEFKASSVYQKIKRFDSI